jgi:hypothetical protein
LKSVSGALADGAEIETAEETGIPASAVQDALEAGDGAEEERMIRPDPLLRYLPGEGPLYQGSRRWR